MNEFRHGHAVERIRPGNKMSRPGDLLEAVADGDGANIIERLRSELDILRAELDHAIELELLRWKLEQVNLVRWKLKTIQGKA